MLCSKQRVLFPEVHITILLNSLALTLVCTSMHGLLYGSLMPAEKSYEIFTEFYKHLIYYIE